MGHFSSSQDRYLLLTFASGENVTLYLMLLWEWTISPFQGFLKITWSGPDPAEISKAPYSLVGTEDKIYFEV